MKINWTTVLLGATAAGAGFLIYQHMTGPAVGKLVAFRQSTPAGDVLLSGKILSVNQDGSYQIRVQTLPGQAPALPPNLQAALNQAGDLGIPVRKEQITQVYS